MYNSIVVLTFPCILWVATLGTSSQFIPHPLILHPCSRLLPSLIHFTTVFGIVELYYSGVPSGDFFVGLALHIGVTYVSISIGLNVIVSCMICARISYLGIAMHAIHHTERGQEMVKYAGTIPIIVESALPYAMAGIAFAVSYGIGSDISVFFMSIYAMFTVSVSLVSFIPNGFAPFQDD